MDSTSHSLDLHPRLIDAIRRGRCVAFVGAGFSKVAGLPTWRELVTMLATAPELPEKTRNALAPMVANNPPDHVLDEIAQRVSDGLPDPKGGQTSSKQFISLLRRCLQTSSSDPAAASRMEARLRHLKGIPFKAILTLNFDDFLVGKSPDKDLYRDILRQDFDRWDSRFWNKTDPGGGAPVINLHGSVRADKIVLTRRGYRDQVHGDPAYLPFLRTMLGQYTILYLGYSFTDPYLQELRSELLSLYGSKKSEPLAYAFREDVDPSRKEYWEEHEGIELISYSSEDGHMGFDHLLRALHDITNPVAELRRLLAGKRILWLDKHPSNNDDARTILLDMVPGYGGPGVPQPHIEPVTELEEATAALQRERWDLVLTHWGEGDGPGGTSNAEALLGVIRREDHRAPVIVYSFSAHAAARRPTALALGAQAYTGRHGELFAAITRVLGEDRLTGP